MYLSRILVSVLFLVSFFCSTFAVNTTSTLKPVTVGKAGANNTTKNTTPKTTISQNATLTRLGENVSKNGTRTGAAVGSTGKITTRFGAGADGYIVEQECQCTLSYLCNPENRVTCVECPDPAFICCKIPYVSVSIPNPAPLGYVESPSPQPSSSNSATDDCTCVIHSECLDPTIKEGGGGIFQPRFECKSPDVCCPNDKISKAREPPPSPVPPIYFPQPPVTENPSPECVCVNNEACLDQDFISGGGFNINPRFKTCVHPQVCCPADKVYVGSTIYPPVIVTEPPTPIPVPFPQPADPTAYNLEYCGKRQGIEKRITAPEDWAKTDFGEFPWMVLILKMEFAKDGSFVDEELLCGGSLLSASVVLTAAHCVHGLDKGVMKIRAGEYDTRQGAFEPKIHQDRLVDKISIHEKFDTRVLYNDLALIRVSENFLLDSHIFPICIPHITSSYADSTIYDPNVCVATGWGKNAFHNGHYQNTLKKVDLSIVPRDECQLKLQQTKLTPAFKLHSSFLCAKGLIGHDTCKGDGGGPLVCALRDDPNRYVQVGIVAWGLECGLDVPAVYASLEANKIWLTNELNLMSAFRRKS